jgi:hypothetical protein
LIPTSSTRVSAGMTTVSADWPGGAVFDGKLL